MGTRKTSTRNSSSGRINAWALRRLLRSARARRCFSVGPVTSVKGTAVAITNSGKRAAEAAGLNARRARGTGRGGSTSGQALPRWERAWPGLLGGPGGEALLQGLAEVGPEADVHSHLVLDVVRGGGHVAQQVLVQ